MSGGPGFSWFEVELTSDHVPDEVEGGQGFSWFKVELVSEHVPGGEPEPEPEPTPDFGGGADQRFAASPILGREVEFTFPGRVAAATREVEFAFSGVVSSSRTIEWSVPASSRASRTVELAFAGERAPAHIWANIIRSDDELLLLL
jgi:hypothetical protein